MASKSEKTDQLILVDGSGSMSGPEQAFVQYAIKAAVAKAEAAGKTIKVFVLSDRSAHEAKSFDQLDLMCGAFSGYSFASLPASAKEAKRIVLLTDGQVPPDSVDQIMRFSPKTNVISVRPEEAMQDFKEMCDVRQIRCVEASGHNIIHSVAEALDKGFPKSVIDTRDINIVRAEKKIVRELEKAQQRVSWHAARLQDNFTARNQLNAERKGLTREFKKAITERDKLEAALAAFKSPAKTPAQKA